MNLRPLSILLLSAIALAGCGAPSQFGRARDLEKDGYFVEACLRYEAVARTYPQHALAPEALYRVARIYQKQLKLYSQAAQYYQELLKGWPAPSPWAARAQRGLMTSPDYFPLAPGSFWIEGDSQTGGGNMRAEWTATAVSSTVWCMQRRISAGATIVATLKRYYALTGTELRESDTPALRRPAVLLSYPFFAGKTWRTERDGRSVVCAIVDRTSTVRTQAGEFTGCLKVRETNPLAPGSVKYTYYAPEVGWVLTTTASAGGAEHRNTELLSNKIAHEAAQVR